MTVVPLIPVSSPEPYANLASLGMGTVEICLGALVLVIALRMILRAFGENECSGKS